MDGRDLSMKDRRKEGLWNGWKGSMMKDRRKEGLWNGWKGSIDEGQKEGRFMEWMEGIDR